MGNSLRLARSTLIEVSDSVSDTRGGFQIISYVLDLPSLANIDLDFVAALLIPRSICLSYTPERRDSEIRAW